MNEVKTKQVIRYLFIAAITLWVIVVATAYIFANWLVGLLK